MKGKRATTGKVLICVAALLDPYLNEAKLEHSRQLNSDQSEKLFSEGGSFRQYLYGIKVELQGSTFMPSR